MLTTMASAQTAAGDVRERAEGGRASPPYGPPVQVFVRLTKAGSGGAADGDGCRC